MNWPVSPHRAAYRNPGSVVAAVSLAAYLAACGPSRTVEPEIRTVTVNVPVAVSCVPAGTPEHQPARAVLPADTGGVVQAMAAELIERRAFDDAVEPVMAACRRAGQNPTPPG